MVCYALWIAQALLALLFLLTGGMKLVVPMDVLIEQMPVPLPAVFVRLLGAAEVAGAFGLILPGLLRIGTGLTSLAASGLVIINDRCRDVHATRGFHPCGHSGRRGNPRGVCGLRPLAVGAAGEWPVAAIRAAEGAGPCLVQTP